jgi:hypothetical protein
MEIQDYVLAATLLGVTDEDAQKQFKPCATLLAGVIACGGKEKEDAKEALLSAAEAVNAQLPSLIEKLKAL